MAAKKTSTGKRADKGAAKPAARPATTKAPAKAPAAAAPASAMPKRVVAAAAVAAPKRKAPAKPAPVPAAPEPAYESAFSVGDGVSHKTFGGGKVVEVDGERLVIAFPKIGTKTIIDSFVQSTKKR